MEDSFGPEDLDRLLAFQGYRNPRGDFWFMGMEDQGLGTALELRWRLSFAQIEDLIAVHSRWEQFKPGDRFNAERLIPTWATMSKIVLRLKGLANWSDFEEVRRYEAERLGRLDGETFLTEVLPLPAPNARDWPANAWFETRGQYETEVRPRRIALLQALHQTHSPRYVFCYGTGNWAHHREIFSDVSFEPIHDGRVLVGRSRSSTIVLTPLPDDQRPDRRDRPSFRGATLPY